MNTETDELIEGLLRRLREKAEMHVDGEEFLPAIELISTIRLIEDEEFGEASEWIEIYGREK